MFTEILKRDGRGEPFQQEKITHAISKALQEIRRFEPVEAKSIAEELTTAVIERLCNRYRENEIPAVEEVQDIVERVLMDKGFMDEAKAYILYRQAHHVTRRTKHFLGVADDLKLSVNAVKVLERRYLRKDDRGEAIETPREMLERVAQAVAAAEADYCDTAEQEQWEERFFQQMLSLAFLPNSPTLMNAGTELGQLSACFVLPVGDSIDEIFTALRSMALIHQSGGGTGFSFSELRPQHDIVQSAGGVASGPVSFIRVFDTATDVVKQGGRRRGANMGILDVDHPDIMEFISAKLDNRSFTNFNFSIAVPDAFMEAVKQRDTFALRNPRNGEVVSELKAADPFDLIAAAAWQCGDPGLVFIDEINRHNPTPALGRIEATNPCGEQPLLPYESCNLGSINLGNMIKNGKLEHERLERAVETAVRFLDNVIDVSNYPLPEIEEMTRRTRRIGLGVMGFADALVKLGIPYNSKEALETGEQIMRLINETADNYSRRLGEIKGSFPAFSESIWADRCDARRNAATTTIAPTGTISIIAGVSSGIEPLFAVSYLRTIMEGTKLIEHNPLFEAAVRSEFSDPEDILMRAAQTGSVQQLPGIPERIRRLFTTAFDITPEWHVKMQASFQKHCENAVSKTVNLRYYATHEDIKSAYMLAYELKCKGITVYRYGSGGGEQPLRFLDEKQAKVGASTPIVDSEFTGECRRCSI